MLKDAPQYSYADYSSVYLKKKAVSSVLKILSGGLDIARRVALKAMTGIPHYNDLKTLYYPFIIIFRPALCFSPVHHTLHFIS